MTIPQAAIEAVKQRWTWKSMHWTDLDSDQITAVLEAAMPHIRKQIADEIKAEALREAAAECWEGYEVTDNRGVYLWLERRAKKLEGKP